MVPYGSCLNLSDEQARLNLFGCATMKQGLKKLFLQLAMTFFSSSHSWIMTITTGILSCLMMAANIDMNGGST